MRCQTKGKPPETQGCFSLQNPYNLCKMKDARNNEMLEQERWGNPIVQGLVVQGLLQSAFISDSAVYYTKGWFFQNSLAKESRSIAGI